MANKSEEGPICGPVTNTPIRKPAYGPLFFLRTGMLLFAWCCTSIAIALEFWATNRAIQNQNTLFNAFNSPAVVWVSVHDIYTTSTITAIGFCFLWIVFTIGIFMSLRYARKPYESFNNISFIISALSIWVLISGAAETWSFARSGIKLYVSIDNVRVPQSDLDAVLNASGIPIRYQDSTMWKVTIAFVWIAWAVAVITALLLFIADSESQRFVKPTALSGDPLSASAIALVNFNDSVKRASLDRPHPLHKGAAGEAAGAKACKESEIQEVPIDSKLKRSGMLGSTHRSEQSVSLPRAGFDAARGEAGMSPLDLGKK
ncbi:hypothetical protein BJ912DRAFT_983591 [Pholiota molesta]|nr:hypothetical protein BJ912DRAFT_983591 [Pholiota molesta]